MRTCRFKRSQDHPVSCVYGRRIWLVFLVLLGPSVLCAAAQDRQRELSDRIARLTESMVRTQAQLQQSQRELTEMRAQLLALQHLVAASADGGAMPAAEASEPSDLPQNSETALASAVEDLRERQNVQATQIATHEQAKVESESRYPVKITGLVLLSSFVNTRAVDTAATPAIALPGSGSTGATLRQTVLGADAEGPRLMGARSYADFRLDFDGSTPSASGGYDAAGGGLLRLRTAHAGLRWQDTDLAFSLDRPIFSPDTPTSLTAVAVPALAWSGNLWVWSPQVSITSDSGVFASRRLRLQSALIEVADAPMAPQPRSSSLNAILPATSAERSRWPGIEARVALLGPPQPGAAGVSHIGIGGYFAPHYSTLLNSRFDAWAATLDARQRLPARLEFSGSFYRGQALGGLGGGAFRDIAYRTYGDKYDSHPLDDTGGWTQLKEELTERVEFNAAFGIDNAFARELRYYTPSGGSLYQNLARNRTYTGNVIYSPSSFLTFSLEYRHLTSFPVVGHPAESDIVGVATGYKF